MDARLEIIELDAAQALAAAGELGEVLYDCVAGGASVHFMLSFTREESQAYFEDVAAEVGRGSTALLAARLDGKFVGTVQLGLSTPPNQPHRADVKKLLVQRSARGRGVGQALMIEIERLAARSGRSLLVLDTVTGGEGERLYQRQGWTRVGVIPDYALFPGGGYCSTTYFWKRIGD